MNNITLEFHFSYQLSHQLSHQENEQLVVELKNKMWRDLSLWLSDLLCARLEQPLKEHFKKEFGK